MNNIKKEQLIPAYDRPGFAVFVKLSSLRADTHAKKCVAVFDRLDSALQKLARDPRTDWFPNPIGGAIFVRKPDKALRAAATLMGLMTALRVRVSIAITYGRFQRVLNVNRWNVTAVPLNLAARMASIAGAEGKTVVDATVRELAEHSCPALFGKLQSDKVKRTRVEYCEVLGVQYRQGTGFIEKWDEVEVADIWLADIVCFDIERYSEKTPKKQNSQAATLSENVEQSQQASLLLPRTYLSAGDGGFIIFEPGRLDTARAALTVARNLRERVSTEGIPVRIGIHRGEVARTKYRRAVGGAILRAEQVSSLGKARKGLSASKIFWDPVLREEFKDQLIAEASKKDAKVFLLREVRKRKLSWRLVCWCLVLILPSSLLNGCVWNTCFGHHQGLGFDQPDQWKRSSSAVQLRGEEVFVPAGKWIAVKLLQERRLSDFQVRFRLRFTKIGQQTGDLAEWVLRSNLSGNSSPATFKDIPGYHFRLIHRRNGNLVIKGAVVNPSGHSEPLEGPTDEHSIGSSQCCNEGQDLEIHAVVIGARIFHCRLLQDTNKEPDLAEVGAPMWDSLNGFVSRHSIDPGGVVIGATANSDVVVSDLYAAEPPRRDLIRCFLNGRYCFGRGAPNTCP
jgi:class 3 adenylate cyclase